MSHSDDDDLALRSLEGPAGEDATCSCDDCRETLATYRRMVDAARADVALEQPAPAVWDRIAATIAAEQDRPATEQGDPTAAGPDPQSASAPAGEAGLPAPTPLRAPRTAGNRARGGHRTTGGARRRWQQVGLVAASLAIGIVGTVTVQQLTSSPQPETLATTELEPLPGWDAAGTATVEQVGSRREVVIDLPEPPVGGYREVWLIDRDVQRLISLGVLTSDEGRFTVPADVDLDDFPIVDVSDEPLDGDPAHSGDSIARGELG